MTQTAKTPYLEAFDEVAALQEQEKKRLLADNEKPDPADYPATIVRMFRWYDRVLGRVVEEPFEIRLLDYKERLRRARTAGLMAQVTWALLPDDMQQYLLALATSEILWPNASESWKRTIMDREDVAITSYVAVENHRSEHFRGRDGAGGEDEVPVGLDIRPVSTPTADIGG